MMQFRFRRRRASPLFYGVTELSPPLGGRPRIFPGLALVALALALGLIFAFSGR